MVHFVNPHGGFMPYSTLSLAGTTTDACHNLLYIYMHIETRESSFSIMHINSTVIRISEKL